jgi:endoglucanase
MQDLLEDLVETPGVSGRESPVREVIEEYVEDHVDEMEVDDFGNLITRRGEGDFQLMVVAHMDQIGLTVTDIDEDGNLAYCHTGGIVDESLPSQRVTVHGEDDVTGVIGITPPHIREGDENELDYDGLTIDVGAENPEEVAELGIEIDDRVTYDRELEEMANDYLTAPGLDNRVGCAVAVEALQEFDEEYELVTVFSAQEEVGLKGAGTSAYNVDPDVALAVDVSIPEGDTPIEVGEGPDIIMQQAGGRGLITPESVKEWLVDTAEEYDHDYQESVMDGGVTDAASIYKQLGGVPTGSIGVPLKNMHSPVEVVKLEDMEATVDYLADTYRMVGDYF